MATPFLRTEIPFTQSRLKSLIKVYGTYGGYQPSLTGNTTLPSLSSLSLIGAVTKVEVKTTRGATERRELNYDNMAKILEMVPGLVDYDVNFSYVWLYQASFMEACGFAGHTLEYQTRPMLFALQLPTPDPAVIAPKTILLLDCWLKGNPATFDVEEKNDLRIVQSVEIACGGLLEVPGA
jgi:hypothetical protein